MTLKIIDTINERSFFLFELKLKFLGNVCMIRRKEKILIRKLYVSAFVCQFYHFHIMHIVSRNAMLSFFHKKIQSYHIHQVILQ